MSSTTNTLLNTFTKCFLTLQVRVELSACRVCRDQMDRLENVVSEDLRDFQDHLELSEDPVPPVLVDQLENPDNLEIVVNN